MRAGHDSLEKQKRPDAVSYQRTGVEKREFLGEYGRSWEKVTQFAFNMYQNPVIDFICSIYGPKLSLCSP